MLYTICFYISTVLGMIYIIGAVRYANKKRALDKHVSKQLLIPIVSLIAVNLVPNENMMNAGVWGVKPWELYIFIGIYVLIAIIYVRLAQKQVK